MKHVFQTVMKWAFILSFLWQVSMSYAGCLFHHPFEFTWWGNFLIRLQLQQQVGVSIDGTIWKNQFGSRLLVDEPNPRWKTDYWNKTPIFCLIFLLSSFKWYIFPFLWDFYTIYNSHCILIWIHCSNGILDLNSIIFLIFFLQIKRFCLF